MTNAELAAESDFYGHRMVMGMVADRGPAWHYLWLRRRDEMAPEVWSNATTWFEESDWLTFYQQMVAVSGRVHETFNRITSLHPVDAVFTSRAGAALSLSLGLATDPIVPVPTVIIEPRVYSPGSIAHNRVLDADAAARAIGYATCISVYWSEAEKREALECGKLWLSPAGIESIERNAHVIPYAVDTPLDAMKRRSRSKTKMLLFAGRLNANKRFDKVIESYGKVMMARDDVDVWVHSGTGAYNKLVPSLHRWHRTTERLPSRDEYHKILSGASVAAYGSLDEGVNATVLEMLAWGIVMTLPSRPWVEKLFDPIVYPYVFKTWKELPPLLDWLLDNEKEARARLAPIRQLIEERHREELWHDRWQVVLDEIETANEKIEGLRIARERVDDWTGSNPLSLIDVAGGLTGIGRPQMRRVFSTYAMHRACADLDSYDGSVPKYGRQSG